MINYGRGTVGYILTFISLIHGSIACIISYMVVAISIDYQCRNRLKREAKITLLLSANIYLLIFIYTTILSSFNIQTLIGDVYGKNFDSSWCTFGGYMISVTCCAIYHTFVIQAWYRLCRIVYSNYRWLQFFWFYVIIIPSQEVGIIVLLSPVLIWHNAVYLSNESYCFVPFTITRGILWVVFTCYGVPLINLSLIYIRITIFIRQQTNTLSSVTKRRQERDLLAIRRIFINIGLLIAIGVPGIVVLIMHFITGVEHPLTYRIVWIGAEVSMAVLSIEMVFMTPQLKNIVMRKWQQNRITVFEGSIQMRTITTAH